ncbi:uncharacterized protein LOC132705425 isoform X3 [Cylas formicarius]|uniref:uncharacterized protein LOC132705425 isoform X3 n=1 Tax=Cylas formicarius TaxID=197179 RepID=UPI002958CED6|nr:uncharacterized protein LOC132705425 isoform X3 [Cylas formicarius]
MDLTKPCQVFLLGLFCLTTHAIYDEDFEIECSGKTFSNVTLTAYYPDYADQDKEYGYQDKRGKKLRTLQDYLDDRADYVTLSMDEKLGVPYGTEVCIPELNRHFGHRVRLEVRDSSYDLYGEGYSRADICVRSEIDSYDESVNKVVTLIFT